MQPTTIFFITDRLLQFYNFEKLKSLYNLRLILLTDSNYKCDSFSETYKVKSSIDDFLPKLSYDDIEYYVANEITQNIVCYVVCNDDVNFSIAEKIKRKFNLHSMPEEQAEFFSDKILMKEKLLNTHVKTPKFLVFDNSKYKKNRDAYFQCLSESLGLPFVMKPRNAAASKGFLKINSLSNFEDLYNNKKIDFSFYEAEEFIDGTLYHCDSLIENDEIIFQKISKYNRPMSDFLSGYPIFSLPLEQNSDENKLMKEFSLKVLQQFCLPTGASHMEFFQKKTGELLFLEIATRAPGGVAVPAYEKQFGINMLEEDLKIRIGKNSDIKEKFSGYHAAWGLYPLRDGIVKKHFNPNIKSKYELFWYVSEGALTKNSETLSEKLAAIVLYHTDRLVLENDLKTLSEYHPVY